jgi:glutathione-specific gamma-glutamylcyclotransferase
MLHRDDFTAAHLSRLAGLSGQRTRSAAQLETSRRRHLRDHRGELWVFGYGSLMWTPAISFRESVSARASAWSRSFCLDMPHGRGTVERPGLMLGLVAGGCCDGIAYRIDALAVETETQILWLREMAFPGYRPAWVRLDSIPADALTFVADEQHVVHQGLTLAEQADRIAAAEGALGTNADYIFRTVAAVHAAEGSDLYLEQLAALVTAREAPSSSGGSAGLPAAATAPGHPAGESCAAIDT